MQNTRISTIHDERYIASIKILIEARKEAKISQTELADQMGLTQPDISKIERLERRLDICEFIDMLNIISNNKSVNFNTIWESIKSFHTKK